MKSKIDYFNIKFFLHSILFLIISFLAYSYVIAADEYETKTIIIEPEKTITKTILKDFIVADFDHDGVADEEDLYPKTPFHFIVLDENLDGIDDALEIKINS